MREVFRFSGVNAGSAGSVAASRPVVTAAPVGNAPAPAQPAPASSSSQLNLEGTGFRQVTHAELIERGLDVEVLRANALDVCLLSHATSCGWVPLYVVPHSLTGVKDFTRTVATPESIAATLEGNASLGFPVSVTPPDMTEFRQVTHAELVDLGFDADILSANALDVNLLSHATSDGIIPLYVVPHSLTGVADFTRTVATPEMVTATLEGNASLGFPVSVSSNNMSQPAQMTREELVAAGFDIDVFVSNTAGENFAANASGIVPFYAVPHSFARRTDITETLP